MRCRGIFLFLGSSKRNLKGCFRICVRIVGIWGSFFVFGVEKMGAFGDNNTQSHIVSRKSLGVKFYTFGNFAEKRKIPESAIQHFFTFLQSTLDYNPEYKRHMYTEQTESSHHSIF